MSDVESKFIPVYVGKGVSEEDNEYVFVGTAEVTEESIHISLNERTNEHVFQDVLKSDDLGGLFIDPVHILPEDEDAPIDEEGDVE